MSRDKDKKDPREKYRPPLVQELFDQDDDGKPKKRRGRPTDLTPRLIKNIAYNILSGASVEIATLMTGVARPTYYQWRDKGRKARSSTNQKEREDNAIYIEFVDTCEEAKANHEGLLETISTKAAEKNVHAAHWRLERLERIKAMVRGKAEKRQAAKEAENATGDGKATFQFFMPMKDDQPLDVVCAKCGEEYDEKRKCKCTKGSPLKRLLAGEELPLELLKKVADAAGVEVDENDPQGTAERIRKALEGE